MKPINFYDLPDEKRKEIVKEAMEEAEKLQAKLVKKYERKHTTKRQGVHISGIQDT